MNHRERLRAALQHKEPDRVPLDLGGTCDSTMMAVLYPKFRRALGLPSVTTRVLDVVGQTAAIDEDVRQALDVDTAPVLDEPRAWRPATLTDGSPATFPAHFQPQTLPDGSQVVADANGTPTLRMPPGGHYFDPVNPPLADVDEAGHLDKYRDLIVYYDTPGYMDKTYEERAAEVKALRAQTDYALVAFFGGHLLQAGQVLRGWETFLTDLLANQSFAHALLERLTAAHLERLDHFARTIGPHVDVIQFEEDLGAQDRPLMRPKVFREMLKPYMAQLFRAAKAKCPNAFVLLHTDGAVAPFIPDFIEMGVDALNPVQLSAAGMDAATLKREFGRDIAFWGAGADPQKTLPFGTPQQVADEVRRHIDVLAPGGGFVFAGVHNIQKEAPPENAIAMFRTARAHGVNSR